MYSYTLFFFLLGLILPCRPCRLAYLKIFFKLLFARKSNRNQRQSIMANSMSMGKKEVGINEFRIIRFTVTIWALFLITWTLYTFAYLAGLVCKWLQQFHEKNDVMSHKNISIVFETCNLCWDSNLQIISSSCHSKLYFSLRSLFSNFHVPIL